MVPVAVGWEKNKDKQDAEKHGMGRAVLGDVRRLEAKKKWRRLRW